MTRPELAKEIRSLCRRLRYAVGLYLRTFCLLTISLVFLTGCETIWTVSFFGASLSVQFPKRPTPTLTATVATMPAEAKP